MILIATKIVLLAAAFGIADCYLKNCTKVMEDAKIIPNYADKGTPGNLKVVYDGNNTVDCGNSLSVLTTSSRPKVTYNAKEKCDYVSILMFDPDGVPPAFLHWLVVNIPCNILKGGYNKQAGSVIYEYLPPGSATDNHPYTFCVYCQSKKFNPCSFPNRNADTRMGFDPKEFTTRRSLGNPEACNFLYVNMLGPAQPDVPVGSELTRKMGNTDDK